MLSCDDSMSDDMKCETSDDVWQRCVGVEQHNGILERHDGVES